jgi:hypothetical protein
LAAYALLFGLTMAVAAKSFDRYLLPAFPAVDLLAGLGLALSVRRLRWIGGAGQLLAATCLLPLLAYPLAISLPYALTWYNPLAGGGTAAQQVLAVGWGEGLDLVARHLNGKPNAEQLKVGLPGEIYTTVLDSQFAGQVMPIQGGNPSAGDPDYFVTYIRSPQETLPTYDPRFQAWPPEAVVRLAGLEYARVYPLEVGIPLGARFGDLVVLEGYGLETLTLRAGRQLDLELYWRALGQLPPGARVAIVLTDLAGREITRADPPLGDLSPGDLRSRTYQPVLPPSLRPGEYLLWIAVEPLVGHPLPLAGRPASLAPEAPESPTRAVLRTILIR